MQTLLLLPSPQLRPYVELYLDVKSPVSSLAEPDRLVRLYPAPTISMAFSYGSVSSSVRFDGGDPLPTPRLSLGGNYTCPKEYSWRGGLELFSVCFKPWGVRNLTRFPLKEATNQNLDLHYVFGNRVKIVEERLCECNTPYERRNVVESFLFSELQAYREDRLVVNAIENIVRKVGCLQVQEIAGEYGLSRKQFVRRFQESVGISPKLFSRIIRFQHTLRLLKGPVKNIEVAYESGYFDQAHFTKDFRELAGVSPGKFLSSIQRSQLGTEFDEAAQMSPFYNTIYQ